MTREEVYKLIEDERVYQDSKWPEGRPESDAETPVSSWIIYMKHHLDLAEAAIYHLDKSLALENIRKLAALGVACMEYNDTPAR